LVSTLLLAEKDKLLWLLFMAFVNIPGNSNWEYDNNPPDPGGALSALWATGTNGIRTTSGGQKIYMNCRHKTLHAGRASVPNEISKSFWDIEHGTIQYDITTQGGQSLLTENGQILEQEYV
jgi:hypothetical protein